MSLSNETSVSDDTLIAVVTVPICLCGALANVMTLSYFVHKEYKTLNEKLLMLLNAQDMVMCFISPGYRCVWL